MTIRKLFDHFDTYENLHVDVNAIRDHIVDLGFQDEINFYFVDMDPTLVRGMIHRWTRRRKVYGDWEYVSDIYISDNQDEAWKRLTAAKELLHILDPEPVAAESKGAVRALIENLAVSPELKIPTKEKPASTFNDEYRIYVAIAILLPKECREMLRPLFNAGKISLEKIAEISLIPPRHAHLAMSDHFEELIEVIIAAEEALAKNGSTS